jgi:uncharacterized protein (TIGR00297 family)
MTYPNPSAFATLLAKEEEQMLTQLVNAFLLSTAVTALAFWRGSLSGSGVLSALVVGTIIYGLGGWQWGVLLGLFFVTSSLLSHFKEDEKRTAAEKFDKGHQRDSGQVFANGGLGALLALLSVFVLSPLWAVAFVGVMATVTADTWATELGTLSKRPPRLITNGRLVEVGTSGGISLLGTTVSLIGGLLIGLAAGLMGMGTTVVGTAVVVAVVGAISGLVGSLFDSLLGATVQQIYYCDTCHKETERKVHKCGTATRPLRGWSWLNNDLVNLISSVVGGGTAVLLLNLL